MPQQAQRYEKPSTSDLKQRLTPLQFEVTQHEATELTFVQETAQLDQPLIEPVLRDDGERYPMPAAGADEPVRGRKRDLDRLLHHDMLARGGDLRPDGGVEAAWNADADDVDIGAVRSPLAVAETGAV